MIEEKLYYVNIMDEPIIAKDAENAIIAFANYMLKHPDMFVDCCSEYEKE